MEKKICNDTTGDDKKLHVFIEFCIATMVGTLISVIPFPHAIWAAIIAFVVAFAFGIWKEKKDAKQAGNHFCIWDLMWDAVGCLGGSVVAFLANYYTYNL